MEKKNKKNAETINNVNESHTDPTLNAILKKLAEYEYKIVVIRNMAIVLDANKSDAATLNARLRPLKTSPLYL